jgi:tetratricopeptide (TPR) repeat protein
MSSDFELTTINRNIQKCISKACLGTDPIDALVVEEEFVPKEGWLWDYKECLNTDPSSLAKTVLQIVSFHNTCGGYLLYGVKETVKDKEFIPVNVDFAKFNPAQLRDLIKIFTGNIIDISFSQVDYDHKGEVFNLGLIHIPKRSHKENPISFIKKSPEKKPGKHHFYPDEVYFRLLDECIKASSTSDWQTLFSSRDFDASLGLSNSLKNYNSSLTHNLPDRNLICSKLIGRELAMSQLWEWLSDDFEYTKILSGDGGKGKTSIAYEFCRSFIKTPPAGYERVVWLSVKESQFSGFENNFYELQESDFTCSLTFMRCLAEICAVDNTDFSEVSIRVIKKELRASLEMFPSLIVVDDVDSLQEDEQRKVVDICRQLGGEKVRFLITTRKKFAYSSDLCIDILGLPIDEYKAYVNSLVTKYSLKSIKSNEIDKLHETCDGSPLLTSSILRFFKQGMPLMQAIREWSGQAGEDARNAALKREIESLSPEAKRILLTIFFFKNCSYTELRQAASVEQFKLINCLEELQSLFLVNEPKLIDSEERFSISNTTALIVSRMIEQMAFDFQRLKNTVKDMKIGPSSRKIGNRKTVGLAINQSLALLKDNRSKEAIETIDTVLKKLPDNPDLLLMKARCLMSKDKPDYNTARKILRKSVLSGQNKELAYELWYVTEEKLDSLNGMIECSEYALKLIDSNESQWSEKLARAYILRSNVRTGSSAVTDMMEASLALSRFLENLNGVAKELRIQELYELHNLIWKLLETGSISWLSSFNEVLELIQRGDCRTAMYINAKRCLSEASSEPNFTGKKVDAYNICAKKFKEQILSRPEKDKIDRPFHDLLNKL